MHLPRQKISSRFSASACSLFSFFRPPLFFELFIPHSWIATTAYCMWTAHIIVSNAVVSSDVSIYSTVFVRYIQLRAEEGVSTQQMSASGQCQSDESFVSVFCAFVCQLPTMLATAGFFISIGQAMRCTITR